jgi:FolB domain-containing protein
MRDKVILTNLRARGVLGVHDWERTAPREIIINVTMFVSPFPAAQSDDISDCVNYSVVAEKLLAHVEGAARMTIEALANDLAEICLQDSRVKGVVLRVDKPGAVLQADSAAVEVERFRSN